MPSGNSSSIGYIFFTSVQNKNSITGKHAIFAIRRKKTWRKNLVLLEKMNYWLSSSITLWWEVISGSWHEKHFFFNVLAQWRVHSCPALFLKCVLSPLERNKNFRRCTVSWWLILQGDHMCINSGRHCFYVLFWKWFKLNEVKWGKECFYNVLLTLPCAENERWVAH